MALTDEELAARARAAELNGVRYDEQSNPGGLAGEGYKINWPRGMNDTAILAGAVAREVTAGVASSAAAEAAKVTAEAAQALSEAALAAGEAARDTVIAAQAATTAVRDEAQAAQSAAEAAEAEAGTAREAVEARYLGAASSDPLAGNSGASLVPGALYFNPTLGVFRGWTGTAWQDLVGAGDADRLPAGSAAHLGAGYRLSADGSTVEFIHFAPEPRPDALVLTPYDVVTGQTSCTISGYPAGFGPARVQTLGGIEVSVDNGASWGTLSEAENGTTLLLRPTVPALVDGETYRGTLQVGGAEVAYAFPYQSLFIFTPSITGPADGATDIQDEPVFTASAYDVMPTDQQDTANPHQDTDWELYSDASFTHLLWSSLADAVNKREVQGPALSESTTYHVRVRYRSTTGLVSLWGAASFTTADMFNWVYPPTVTSPAAGAVNISQTPAITLSPFTATDTDIHLATRVQLIGDDPYATVLYDSGTLGPVTSVSPDVTLDMGATVYVRASYQGVTYGWSEWSEQSAFTVLVLPTAPTLLSPVGGATNVPRAPTMTVSGFSVSIGSDTHVATHYQVAADSGFSEILYDSGAVGDLLSHTIPSGSPLPMGTVVYARVRQKGNVLGWSDWSNVVSWTIEVAGEIVFPPGVTNWVVPDKVTSISGFVVGAGGYGGRHPSGGGGGGSVWISNVPVSPGQIIPVTVGICPASVDSSGQSSSIGGYATAYGGSSGGTGGVGGGGSIAAGITGAVGTGGSAGGSAIGCGAAGYGGPGGSPGQGGSNGGGAAGYGNTQGTGRGGGGVGLYGQGADGLYPDGGGSGGSHGTGEPYSGGIGGLCGGGGGGSAYGTPYAPGRGGNGGVRIIWGPGRSYPHNAA